VTTGPEWSDFRVLLALSRAGSVAGAARILRVDASTVSRRLAAAEEAMGAVLLVRGGREFAFTQEGRAALEAAETMEAAVNSATAQVRASRAESLGLVRLSVFPSIAEFLRPFPETVADAHPGVTVELRASRNAVDLAGGQADIAVRVNRELPQDLVMRHAFDLGLALYGSTPYLDAAGRPTTAEDLHRHQLVLYTEDFHPYPFAAWIEQYADTNLPVMRVDSVEMARSMIAAGGGIGVLWCCHGDPLPTLERVLPDPVSSVEVCLVYHRSLRGAARIKAVADLLVTYLTDNHAVLSGRLEPI